MKLTEAFILKDSFEFSGHLSKLDVDEVKDILIPYTSSLKKYNIQIDGLTYIDSGHNASVFKMKDGRILKITGDGSDASALSIVSHADLENIIKVYFVGELVSKEELQDDPRNYYHELKNDKKRGFVVVTEFIEPLNKNRKNDFADEIMDMSTEIDSPLWGKRAISSSKEWLKNLYRHMARLEAQIKRGDDKRYNGQLQEYVKLYDNLAKVMKHYKILDTIDQFASVGVSLIDFMFKNIGQRSDGTYVLFDLGHSIVKKRSDIYKIEIGGLDARPYSS